MNEIMQDAIMTLQTSRRLTQLAKFCGIAQTAALCGAAASLVAGGVRVARAFQQTKN
jgi:hypothetical protein